MSEHAQDWRQLIGQCVVIRKPDDPLTGRAGVILYPVTRFESDGDGVRYAVLVGGAVRRTYDLSDLEVNR